MTNNDDDSFISLSTIDGFQSHPEYVSAYSLSYSYPILAIVVSSKQIVTFNLETKETTKLQRNAIDDPSSTVLSSAISNGKTRIVTGHSDSQGGEIVIWSLKTKSDIFSFRMEYGVSKVQFGNTHDQIFHASLMGVLTLSTMTKIFKKTVNHKEIKNFEGPVISMVVHKGRLFVSVSQLTTCIDLDTLKEIYTISEETNCFAFYDTTTFKGVPETYLARGFDQQITVSTIEGENPVTYDISKTPKSITFIDLNTILVLHNTGCELIRDNNHIYQSIPSGLAIGFSDRIFVLNNEHLYQLSLKSIEEQVNVYVKNNQWERAFDQISSINDYQNLDELFNKYIQSGEFNAVYLFKLCERLERTDFITELKFIKQELPKDLTEYNLNETEIQILKMFVKSGIMHWILNLNFILMILIAYKDKQSDELFQFLTTIELNFQWLPDIYEYCLNENMFQTMSALSLAYSSDYFLNLVINHYEEKYQEIHELIDKILINAKIAPEQVLLYLLSVDLTHFIRYDVDHSALVIQTAFDFIMEQANRPLQPPKDYISLLNKVIYAIDKDDKPIWTFLIEKVIQINKIQIEKDLMPQIENFIYASNACDIHMRDQLLIYLLNSGQINDLQRTFCLVRSCGLENSEFEIIRYTRNVSEFISFVIEKKRNSFRDGLYRVLHDDLNEIQNVYIDRCSLFLSINPDEFCGEILKFRNVQMVHKIYERLCDNKILLWHFMKRVFICDQFHDCLTEAEFINYISLLAKYHPEQVYGVLHSFQNIPLRKISEICKSRGILDAYLYVCSLLHADREALDFGKDYLCTSLMENQSFRVVQQVCDYLSSVPADNKEDAWFEFLSAFQIPIYSFMYDSKMKLETEKRKNVIGLLEFFIDAMIKDADENSSNTVAQNFIVLFSFLPFSIARPIVTNLFKSIREKNQFKGTLVQIQKHEAVVNQTNRIREKARGMEYDGTRCGLCGKPLGQCEAVAFHCGHVFHDKCAVSGWCSICDASSESKIEEQNNLARPNHSSLIRMDLFSTELPELDPFYREESQNDNMPVLGLPTFGKVENLD